MPTTINTARFRVVSVSSPESGPKSMQLAPVTTGEGGEENRAFFQTAAAPQTHMLGGANINLSGLAAEIEAQFTPGAEFVVSFTPAI